MTPERPGVTALLEALRQGYETEGTDERAPDKGPRAAAASLRAACAGATAALAAHALARREAASIAVVGAAAATRWGLLALATLRPLTCALVYDPTPFRAGPFVAGVAREIGDPQIRLVAADSLPEALVEAEVVLASLESPLPLLYPDMLPEGSHVSALEPHLASRALRAASRVVADQAPLGQVTLGQVLRGEVPGRTRPNERTLYLGADVPAWQLTAARQVQARIQSAPQASGATSPPVRREG